MKQLYLALLASLTFLFAENLSAQCPTNISVTPLTGCGIYQLHLNEFGEVGNIIWTYDNGTPLTSGYNNVTWASDVPGNHVVCAQAWTASCPEGITICADIQVPLCPAWMCPAIIYVSETNNCHEFNFDLGVSNEGEIANWYFDGAAAVTGTSTISHVFESNGLHNVCVFYSSPSYCSEGIELCTTFEVNCPEINCPSAITADQIDCDTYVFHVAGTTGNEVVWNFGDNTPVNYGLNADHTFAENGVYVVTAEFSGPNCPNGVTLNYTVSIDCAQNNDCPTDISHIAPGPCGVMNFEIGSFVEGESVIWYPGDETGAVTGGHFFTHTYASPGVYNVCAFYTSSICPNGVELCTEIEIVSCNESNCPKALIGEQVDCDSYVFHVQGFDAGEVVWNFGDNVSENAGVTADHTYAENGVYVVTAQYFGPNCQQGITLYYTIEVNCSNGVECPTSIASNAGAECGVMNFEIGSFVEGESVIWYPGDETGAATGGHFFSHAYASAGVYNVCAFYTSPNCPNGVELCTEIEIVSCNESNCPTSLIAEQSDCGSYVFHVQGFNAGEVAWNFGDNTSENAGVTADHNYAANGVYIVTAQYFGPNCQQGITLYYTVEVNCSTGTECPTSIASNAGAECGVMNFEIGSFVEGESVIWYPGDESGAVTGGHFFTHTYANPGTYNVCAFYTSPSCPNGVELCTSIVVSPCEQPCNDVIISLDSYINNGGTPQLVYSIFNAQTNEMVLFETVTYTEADPFYDHVICLPDGCYYLTVDNNNPISIGNGLDVFINMNGNNLMETAELVSQDNISFSLLFGVNSNCSQSTSCTAGFTPIFTNTTGHIEFQNTSTFDGTATYFWDYGNGTTSDGASGNVFYEQNGIYNVCLTIQTDNCQDTYCFPVSIQEFETGCTLNEITVTVNAEYSIKASDLIEMAITFENLPIEYWSIATTNGYSNSWTACVPDGCYSVDLNTATPLLADAISCSISLNNTIIETLQLLNEGTSESMTFGVNSECLPINVDEVNNPTWLLFPNPTSDQISVRSTDNSKIQSITVYDITGKMIHSEKPNNELTRIDVSSLPTGVYSAVIFNGQSTQNIRFEVVK